MSAGVPQMATQPAPPGVAEAQTNDEEKKTEVEAPKPLREFRKRAFKYRTLKEPKLDLLQQFNVWEAAGIPRPKRTLYVPPNLVKDISHTLDKLPSFHRQAMSELLTWSLFRRDYKAAAMACLILWRTQSVASLAEAHRFLRTIVNRPLDKWMQRRGLALTLAACTTELILATRAAGLMPLDRYFNVLVKFQPRVRQQHDAARGVAVQLLEMGDYREAKKVLEAKLSRMRDPPGQPQRDALVGLTYYMQWMDAYIGAMPWDGLPGYPATRRSLPAPAAPRSRAVHGDAAGMDLAEPEPSATDIDNPWSDDSDKAGGSRDGSGGREGGAGSGGGDDGEDDGDGGGGGGSEGEDGGGGGGRPRKRRRRSHGGGSSGDGGGGVRREVSGDGGSGTDTGSGDSSGDGGRVGVGRGGDRGRGRGSGSSSRGWDTPEVSDSDGGASLEDGSGGGSGSSGSLVTRSSGGGGESGSQSLGASSGSMSSGGVNGSSSGSDVDVSPSGGGAGEFRRSGRRGRGGGGPGAGGQPWDAGGQGSPAGSGSGGGASSSTSSGDALPSDGDAGGDGGEERIEFAGPTGVGGGADVDSGGAAAGGGEPAADEVEPPSYGLSCRTPPQLRAWEFVPAVWSHVQRSVRDFNRWWREADRAFQDAARHAHSGRTRIAFYRAQSYCAAGRFREAESVAAEALRVCPTDPDAVGLLLLMRRLQRQITQFLGALEAEAGLAEGSAAALLGMRQGGPFT